MLFLQHARRVQPHFELTVNNLPDLIRICRVVSGIPLAIELAASWVGYLSLADIAIEIQKGLNFLQTELRDVPERHRSIQAVFNQSWRQLTPVEQGIFARLSIFRGGFTHRAAEEVAIASSQTLRALVNKSLFQYDGHRDRYEIHELLRQYAASALVSELHGEATTRDQHSAYFCTLLQRWETGLKSARQQVVLSEIEADYENVHAAWFWAVERGNIEHLARAIDGLGEFYDVRGRWHKGEAVFRAAAETLQSVFSRSANDSRMALVLAKILAWQGLFNC
jgi:predicted ATPase